MNSINIKVKRAVSMVILITMVTAFCFPVFAENTYVRELRNYSNSISSASLTYSATAAQLDYVTETTLQGGMYSPVLVTVRFTNNGDNDVKIANSYVDLTFTTYSEVSGYDCYTSDLMVQMVKNGNDTPRYNIVASNGFTYNGHVVIPSHSSMYLVFEVDITASFDTSSAQVVSPSLDAVLVSVNSADVTTGSYLTSGSIPEQLDEIYDMLGTNTGYVYGLNQNIVNIASQVGGIKNLLTEIKALIQYTGSYSQSNSVRSSASSSVTFSNTGATVTITYDYLSSYYLTDDVVINGNTLITSGTRVTPAILRIRVYNPNLYTIQTFPTWTITGIPQYSMEITYGFGEMFNGAYIASNGIVFTLAHPIGTSSYLANVRDQYYQLYINIYTNSTINPPSASNINLGLTYTREAVSTEYAPANEYFILRDIYLGMQSSNQQNVSHDSGTLKTESDSAHQQEQSYFAQNLQAIQATGLSNYRFDTVQQNGINAVSIDFTQLWNALGAWNSVYIFSLTLTLSLTILRHAPNAISRRMRKKQE